MCESMEKMVVRRQGHHMKGEAKQVSTNAQCSNQRITLSPVLKENICKDEKKGRKKC